MICGLIASTTSPQRCTTSWLSVVTATPYSLASASSRSRRGPLATIFDAGTCPPRTSPRMSDSAMLPAPMNPIVCAARIDIRSTDVEVFLLVYHAGFEPAERVTLEDLVRRAAGEPLRVELADDRRHHEAVADKAAREEEVGMPRRRADDRIAVG